MEMDYRIALLSSGTDPDDWDLLAQILNDAGIPGAVTSEYVQYPEILIAGDASRVGRGMSYFTWTMQILRPAQRNAFRTYCSGLSAEVYARTLSNEFDVNGALTWIDCRAMMVWPQREDHLRVAMLDFQLRFDILEEL